MAKPSKKTETPSDGELLKNLEQKIRDQEEQIRNLQDLEPEEYLQKSFEKARDLILIIQEGRIKYANPMLERLTGFTFEKIRDKNFRDLLTGDVRQMLMERYESRMSGKSVPEKYETVIERKDGEKIYVEISGHLITYKGKPADFAILRDITPMKTLISKLEESETKYRNFFKASKDCVFFTTPDGKWLD